jgi:ferric-dicitrate binding protein FerR (iron transport regulator)
VTESDRHRRELAAYWAVRLTDEQDSITAAERDELASFLADPRNAEEYGVNSRILQMPAELQDPDRERLISWADRHAPHR